MGIARRRARRRARMMFLEIQEEAAVPLYEYKCAKCGQRFEKIEKVNDGARRKCPACGGRAERMVASPAIQFKGTGWYVTDYARKSSPSSGDGKSAESPPKPPASAGESAGKPSKKTSKEK
jgi:putative FmdB family regulatory protein